jgi:adenine-specific DNA methylase
MSVKRSPFRNIDEFDFVSFALCHTEHDKFTEFFVKKNKAIYENYVRLSTEQGMLESFRANPLAVIIMNEPRCCYKIAVEYIAKQFLVNINELFSKDS